MDQVYRPGYGHLAAALGPCWPAHDLCLYALDIASGLWSVLYLQPGRAPGLLSAQAEYQARILPALAAQLADRDHPLRPHPPPEHAMTDDPPCARPWPTPAAAGRSSPACPARRSPPPATATATPPPTSEQITAWFSRHPGRNLAIATGAPGPDVLDVDHHGPAGNGYPAFGQLHTPGCSTARTLRAHPQRRPARLLHRHRPALRPPARHHLDFRSAGGYVLAPPSQVDGHPYRLLGNPRPRRPLNWDASAARCPPSRSGSGPSPARPRTGTWTPWPAGSPPSPRATATPACSGPPTAPSKLTPPPT